MKTNGGYKLVKNLLLKVQGLSRTQAIIAAVTGVVAVGGVGTGGYLIYDHAHQPQEVVADVVMDTEFDSETESLESLWEDTELLALETEAVTEDTETETVEVEQKKLTLVGSSMEKDLKIKIQDQKEKLVSGEQFEVSVKQDKKGAKATSYTDKDKDGIIYIDKLDAGDYVIDLQEIEEYEIAKGSIKVKVKDSLEYKKVDVKDEIKKESEVNAAVEDTAVNNVPVESTITDTVALVESSVKTSTVDKSQVDQSNFTKASASTDVSTATLKKTVKPTEPTEKPETPGSSEPGSSETTKPSEPGSSETTKPSEPGSSETTNPSEPGSSETTNPSEPGSSETTNPSEPGSSETTKPSEPGSSETTNPSEPGSSEVIAPSENPGIATASIARNRVSRVAAAANNAVTAMVSLPKKVTLYNCDKADSNSYKLDLTVAGDATLIKSVTWGCTDPGKITVSALSGNSVMVSAVPGSGNREANVGAVITYYADDKGNTATVTIQTTVQTIDFTDESILLKDKSGNALYKDANARTAATLKDYASTSQFYTSPQYTGWQTIDGKVYYYTADFKPVTGNQVIGGVQYTFAADGSLAQSSGSRGIDVSKWQGNIDWGAVAASGISFAIIRVGYRGASTGALIEDPYFKKNIAGATRAGIKVGVYFFTQAITEAEAVEEASMALALVSGYNLSLPIFIDTESAANGRANGLDSGTRTAIVNAFCRTVAGSGRRAGVYASKNWYGSQLNASALSNYCIWVAQYNASCTYSGKYDIWQYTSKGSVPGISGNVDMNISYM